MKSRHLLVITIIMVALAVGIAPPPPPPKSSSTARPRPVRSSTSGTAGRPSTSTGGRPPRSSSTGGTPTPGDSSTSYKPIIIGSSSSTGIDEASINGAVPPVGPQRVAAFTVISVTAVSALICLCVAVRRHRKNANARRYESQHDDGMIQVEGGMMGGTAGETGETGTGTEMASYGEPSTVENSVNNGGTGDERYTYVTPSEMAAAAVASGEPSQVAPSYPVITPLPLPPATTFAV